MSRATKDYNSIDWNSIFVYDTSSPTGLTWKVDRLAGKSYKIVAAKAGTHAGNIHHDANKNTKYATVPNTGSNWFAHRVIYIMHHGYLDDELVIDHIDGDSLNNSVSNLRAVKQEKNNRNSRKRKDNSTGFTGVNFTTAMGSSLLTYCTAGWYIENNTKKCKHFPVSKYGLLPAFKMACEYREMKIAELNSEGKNYTGLHGTQKGQYEIHG